MTIGSETIQPHLGEPTHEEEPAKRKFRVVQIGYEYDGNEEDPGSQIKGGEDVVWEGDLVKPEDLPREELTLPESDYTDKKDAPAAGDQDYRYTMKEEVDGTWTNIKSIDPNFRKEREQPVA